LTLIPRFVDVTLNLSTKDNKTRRCAFFYGTSVNDGVEISWTGTVPVHNHLTKRKENTRILIEEILYLFLKKLLIQVL
jgi:hypothetical protein